MARLELRLSDDMLERWTAAASTHGWSVSELVRDSVNAQLDSPSVAFASELETAAAAAPAAKPPAAAARSTSPKTKRRRTALCEHRNPPDTYCARCDR